MNPNHKYSTSVLPNFLANNNSSFPIFPQFNYLIINDIFIKKQLTCPICLQVPKSLYRPNSCSHIFCQKCLNLWIDRKRNCPICRQPINHIVKL